MTKEREKLFIFLWLIIIFLFLYNFWLPYVVKILYLEKCPKGLSADFFIYYNAGNLFKFNSSPYFTNGKTTWFFYPPTFLPIYKIISTIPIHLAQHVWRILGIIIFFLVSLLILNKNINTIIIFLSLCVISKPMIHNFVHAQVELFSISLILLSFWCYKNNKKILSAIFLAIGAHWKITPILFIIFYLLKKELNIIIYVIIWVIAIGILSYLYIPHKIFLEYYLQVLPYISQEIRNFPNQGIIALFNYIGGAKISKIMLIFYTIGMLIYLWKIIPKTKINPQQYDIWLFVLVILFIIQISPIAWPPIYTWTIIPSVFMIDFILKSEIRGKKIKYLLIIGLSLMHIGVVNLPFLCHLNLLGNLIIFFSLIFLNKKL